MFFFLCKDFFIFIHNSSARHHQKSKEKLQKRALKRYQNCSDEEKEEKGLYE